jgi:hypothetical protein
MSAVHDPDGNLVELTQLADEWWAQLAKRRAEGHDPVERWLRREPGGGHRPEAAT